MKAVLTWAENLKLYLWNFQTCQCVAFCNFQISKALLEFGSFIDFPITQHILDFHGPLFGRNFKFPSVELQNFSLKLQLFSKFYRAFFKHFGLFSAVPFHLRFIPGIHNCMEIMSPSYSIPSSVSKILIVDKQAGFWQQTCTAVINCNFSELISFWFLVCFTSRVFKLGF